MEHLVQHPPIVRQGIAWSRVRNASRLRGSLHLFWTLIAGCSLTINNMYDRWVRLGVGYRIRVDVSTGALDKSRDSVAVYPIRTMAESNVYRGVTTQRSEGISCSITITLTSLSHMPVPRKPPLGVQTDKGEPKSHPILEQTRCATSESHD